jgi:O-antigen ligase
MNFIEQSIQPLQRQFMPIAAGAMALFIGAVYFSTSLAIILSAVLGVLWLATAQFLRLPALLRRQPVAAWALILFGCFLIGSGYGSATADEAVSMIKKYRELVFMPVLLAFLTTPRYRSWAWTAFVIASVVTLLASYLIDWDIFGLSKLGEPAVPGKPRDPTLKSRITHGIVIAFFCFYCLHKSYDGGRYAIPYLIGSLLCLYNLFFMVEGRTGQLIVLMLIALFAMQRLNKKERWLVVFALAVFLGLFLGFSKKAERINEGFANTQSYFQERSDQTHTSMGQRYTFWKYSLRLIAEKPWFGYGTGSFAGEYRRVAAGEKVMTQNPHNEFMMIGVQLGLFGLIPYAAFFICQFCCWRDLPEQDKRLAQGLFISLLITSLFNTPLFDHTEGHWYITMIALCFAGLGADARAGVRHA